MLRQRLLKAIVHCCIPSQSRCSPSSMEIKYRLWGRQGWPFLSVVWKQFGKSNFFLSTVLSSASGITWHQDSQAVEKLARPCVGSIHRVSQPALSNLVWSQSSSCFEKKFALANSWGPLHYLVIPCFWRKPFQTGHLLELQLQLCRGD